MTNRLIAAALAALLAGPVMAGSDSASGDAATEQTSEETAAATGQTTGETGEQTGEPKSAESEETGDTAATEADVSTPPEPFTEEYLADEAHIAIGREIWQEQCQHCHGKSAYPGKAPKLKPRKYEPDFVYRRVTDGFRKMPPWKDVYTDEERMAVVAYVLSDGFSP